MPLKKSKKIDRDLLFVQVCKTFLINDFKLCSKLVQTIRIEHIGTRVLCNIACVSINSITDGICYSSCDHIIP